jgi:hypothetical protein
MSSRWGGDSKLRRTELGGVRAAEGHISPMMMVRQGSYSGSELRTLIAVWTTLSVTMALKSDSVNVASQMLEPRRLETEMTAW